MRRERTVLHTERNRCVIAFAMASFLVLFLVFSTLFILKEADHECIGEGCPVCAEMLHCAQTVREIGGGVLLTAAAVLTAVFATRTVCLIISEVPALTPVSRKIRMNN